MINDKIKKNKAITKKNQARINKQSCKQRKNQSRKPVQNNRK